MPKRSFRVGCQAKRPVRVTRIFLAFFRKRSHCFVNIWLTGESPDCQFQFAVNRGVGKLKWFFRHVCGTTLSAG